MTDPAARDPWAPEPGTAWAAHHEWGPEGAYGGGGRDRGPGDQGLRHRTDWMALLGGVLFIGIGIRFIAGPPPDALTMLAVLLVGLAFAGLVALIVTATRRR
jgi:hypothetical protein